MNARITRISSRRIVLPLRLFTFDVGELTRELAGALFALFQELLAAIASFDERLNARSSPYVFASVLLTRLKREDSAVSVDDKFLGHRGCPF